MTDVGSIIHEIERLKHFESIKCPKCEYFIQYHCLEIQIYCPNCNTRQKVRSFGGIGTEIYDVIDAVLMWAGTGEELEAVLKRHEIIQNEVKEEKESENEKV